MKIQNKSKIAANLIGKATLIQRPDFLIKNLQSDQVSENESYGEQALLSISKFQHSHSRFSTVAAAVMVAFEGCEAMSLSCLLFGYICCH